MWCASQASASPSHCSQVTSSWPSIIRQILMAPPRNRDKPKAPGAPGPSWGRCAPFWLAQALEGAAAVWRPETGRPIVAAHGRAEVAPAAGPVGAAGHVVQRAGVRVREGAIAHRASVAGQGVDAGDDRRGHAGPAGLEPGAASHAEGVVHRHAGGGVGHRAHVSHRPPRAAAVGLPRRLREHPGAAAAGAAPHRLGPTAVTYCEEAGKESPNPESPAAAVSTWPGWLKAALALRRPWDSGAP